MKRHQIVVAVWKEKLICSQSISAAQDIVEMTKDENWPFVISIAPSPFSIVKVFEAVNGSNITVCSQNILWSEDSGSYIGETTSEMLQEYNCEYAIVGHSERRLSFYENNEMIANRALAAINAGIRPILCIGDTADDKKGGRSDEIISNQLRAFFKTVPDEINEQDFLVAYEPVWAISTWRADWDLPDGAEVQRIHSNLRQLIAEIKGQDFASRISLLYGGSVDPDNAETYMKQPDVDGALVGGASKTAEKFVATLKAARLGFNKKM